MNFPTDPLVDLLKSLSFVSINKLYMYIIMLPDNMKFMVNVKRKWLKSS